MIRIDRELCMGSGRCAQIAPTTFELDSDGRARVLADVGDDDVAYAIDACPMGAISVTPDPASS